MSYDKLYLNIFIAPFLVLIISCSGNNVIPEKQYIDKIEKSFQERRLLADNRKKELFGLFENKLSREQSVALKFLYAYMPLSDLADYNGEFFLANVDKALQARASVPWGKKIPADIFFHYVLPCRINNENLDSFRIAFFDEIHSRIKGKSLPEAALEINYWCQEKVSYKPSDIRTSAPMSTILSARGRCGEESTLMIAALRTAGIPARQVYTPRWAHTDDNHAWVEVYIDGSWYYMGACEPEPVLDRGWFTEPARKAMLVHTKSFGLPWGNENAINIHRNYTEVNCLSKYARTKRLFVKVLDRNEKPAENSTVEYRLYNYAEFYPLTSVPADHNGMSSLETGYGDLLVWAYNGDDFAFKKISVKETDTLVLQLHPLDNNDYSLDLDLNIPVINSPLAGPPPDLIQTNANKVSAGNIVRFEYINTWMKPREAAVLAIRLNLDSSRVKTVFDRSMGNYNEIRKSLANCPDSLRNNAISMLENLPDKDLRDINSDVIADHLLNSVKLGYYDNDLYLRYILNPRISNEMITGWRGWFRNNLPSDLIKAGAENPASIAEYLDKNIAIAEDENYYNTPITPRGVFELKVSDSHSRSICFTAICRSLGIPARIEPVRLITQYFFDGKWNDVFFSDEKKPVRAKGYIHLSSAEKIPVPAYYLNFTLAEFQNGHYKTLEYDFGKKITEFQDELELPAGNYMLVSGNRLIDSSVLAKISFFRLSENEHKKLEVSIRSNVPDNKSKGRIDLNKISALFPGNADNIKRNGAVVIWTQPGHEPTEHVFNDLPALKNEFDAWKGYFLFLNSSTAGKEPYKNNMSGLPERSLFSDDKGLGIFKESVVLKPTLNVTMPFILVADKDGNVLFTSSGYSISTGNQILKYLK